MQINRKDGRICAVGPLLSVKGRAAWVQTSQFNFLDMERVMPPCTLKPGTSGPSQSPSVHTRGGDRSKTGALCDWLRSAFRTWQRHKMMATLHGLDDRLLHDMGIDRRDIPKVVDQLTGRELRMRPVSPDVEHQDRSISQSRVRV